MPARPARRRRDGAAAGERGVRGDRDLDQPLGAPAATLLRMANALQSWSLTVFTPETVSEVIMPTYRETLSVGRADLLSAGFLVALWSGSRALHIFIDAISIMYGQGGDRGPVRARVVSLTAYLAAVVVMGLVLPMLLIGPGYLRDLPGALLTVLLWVVSSVLIRRWAEDAAGGRSVFGPLTAPIILLVYLYFLSFAVLVGASLNAALRRLWPPPEYRGPTARVNEWWGERRASRETRHAERERRRAERALTAEEEEEELEDMDGIPGPR